MQSMPFVGYATIQTMNWNLIGHEWAVNLLKDHVIRGDVHHAYLLSGPRGIGRRTLALLFAQAINCTSPLSPGEPCGVCKTCKQIMLMQQSDLHIVQKPQDRTEIIVDQIRELQHHLVLAPYESSHRIGLILNFDQANENTQNAFLKTLEEAPEKVVLLLHSDTPESLLPTIVSRCEVLRLRPVSITELSEKLQALRQVPEDRANQLAHFAAGKPGLALGYLDNPALYEKRLEAVNSFFELVHSDRRVRFHFAKDAVDTKKGASREDRELMRAELAELFQNWILIWRDILLIASHSNSELVNIDHQNEMDRLAASITPQQAATRIADLETSLNRLNSTNLLLELEVRLLDLPFSS